MLNNFIYAQEKSLFLEQLEAGNILDEAIVFIEDTGEIWNHGTYFASCDYDPDAFAEIQTTVAQLQADKLDSTTAASTYALIENGVNWGTIDSATEVASNEELDLILSSDYPSTIDNAEATKASLVSLLNNKY